MFDEARAASATGARADTGEWMDAIAEDEDGEDGVVGEDAAQVPGPPPTSPLPPAPAPALMPALALALGVPTHKAGDAPRIVVTGAPRAAQAVEAGCSPSPAPGTRAGRGAGRGGKGGGAAEHNRANRVAAGTEGTETEMETEREDEGGRREYDDILRGGRRTTAPVVQASRAHAARRYTMRDPPPPAALALPAFVSESVRTVRISSRGRCVSDADTRLGCGRTTGAPRRRRGRERGMVARRRRRGSAVRLLEGTGSVRSRSRRRASADRGHE